MSRGRASRVGFRHALRGVVWAFASQLNLKIHAVAAVAALAAAAWLRAPLAPMLAAIGLVVVAELANTAVEELVNLVSPEYDPRAGRVKDIAAGGVLVAAATSVAIGLAVLGPPLLARLGRGAP